VIVACAITWTCCAFTALMSLLLVGVLVADADALFAEMYRQNPSLADDGLSDATLKSMTWTIAIVCLLWAVLSSGLAVLAFQRVRWAATSLVVSAGLVALVCLAGSLVSPVLAVPGVLAAVVAVLLLQSGSQRWLARQGEHRGPAA
jgi:ABC-type siderophore export system fused ATPase/permease subunit